MLKRTLAGTAAGLMMLATVTSASADASEKASCVGQLFSQSQPQNGGIGQAIRDLPPGLWGQAISGLAQQDAEACP